MNAIILAHGGASATVARHLPNWEAAFDGLTFISPSDDPLPGSLPIGLSCRNGTGAIERILMAVALASRFDSACIMEYDCLVFFSSAIGPSGHWFDGEVFTQPLFCSEVFPNEDPAELFAAPTYGHCPWIATGETWWRLLTAGADYQMGFPDRWLALAALRANVALRGMQGAYSRDRAFDAVAGRTARLAGAPCVHGCKTAEEFDMVMSEDLSIHTWPEKTGEIDTTGIETKVVHHPAQLMKDAADKVLGKLASEAFVEKIREEGV